jgi:hypothetical protein
MESRLDITESFLYIGIMAEQTVVERRSQRAYMREFIPAVVGYVAILAAIIVFVDFRTAGPWKFPIALLPVIPVLWCFRAVARHLRRLDEMQRTIQVDGMAAGFGLAMVASVTIGFLAMAGLDTDRWGPWAIYSVGMATWGIATVRRRAGAR